jgi:hypothetical protein
VPLGGTGTLPVPRPAGPASRRCGWGAGRLPGEPPSLTIASGEVRHLDRPVSRIHGFYPRPRWAACGQAPRSGQRVLGVTGRSQWMGAACCPVQRYAPTRPRAAADRSIPKATPPGAPGAAVPALAAARRPLGCGRLQQPRAAHFGLSAWARPAAKSGRLVGRTASVKRRDSIVPSAIPGLFRP